MIVENFNFIFFSVKEKSNFGYAFGKWAFYFEVSDNIQIDKTVNFD